MPADRSFFRRHAVAAAVLALAAAVVATGLLSRQSQAEELRTAVEERALPIVKLVTPAAVDAATLELPARLEAWASAPIHARVGGYLKRWTVDIGSPVKAGQLLAEIETPELDEQLLQARAELATARSQAALAESTAQRWQRLLATDAVSRQEADERAGELRARQSMVQGLQANVDRVLAQKQYARLVAPFDGVITARNVDTGQLIDPGAGKELFHLQAIQTLRVFTNLPQIYSSNVKPGAKIGLTFAEHAGKIYQGTLVRTAEAIDPASRTLLVEIDVNNSAGELLPGSLAEVHFKTPPSGPTFIVPAGALIFRKEGLRVGTIVKGEGINGTVAHLVPVVIGQDDGASVQIVSGVGLSDQVIQDPPDSLIEGEKVQVVTPATQSHAGGK